MHVAAVQRAHARVARARAARRPQSCHFPKMEALGGDACRHRNGMLLGNGASVPAYQRTWAPSPTHTHRTVTTQASFGAVLSQNQYLREHIARLDLQMSQVRCRIPTTGLAQR